MSRLQFEFDPVKLGQALAFLAQGIGDLTKLKAAKLLYFADKLHLVRYGRPITGDRYYCLDHGPVPSASLNAMNDLLTPVRIRVGGRTLKNQMSEVLGRFVHVDRKGSHPRLMARESSSKFDALTETEREVLSATAARYGKLPAGRLIELTHKEKTWVTPNKVRRSGSSVEIPWELFLEQEASTVTPEMREHIAEQQESDAFLRAISQTVRR
jgi:uncharacterized phage-associated protein